MLKTGKKIHALRDKKKYSNSRVVRKKISERNQVKWSVPKTILIFFLLSTKLLIGYDILSSSKLLCSNSMYFFKKMYRFWCLNRGYLYA
jgi:hypothetical protein